MTLTRESSVEMAIALCFFFIIMTAIFVAIAVFLPEWIGIAGKKSQDVIREQQGPAHKAEDKSDSHKP